MRLFGRTSTPPVTSYGYQAPAGATVDGWRCPADGCGVGGDAAPRRWPFRCTNCGTAADPTFDEPWAHDARGPWLRHQLRSSRPQLRHIWEGQLHGWLYRDALQAGDRSAAEHARSDAHRFVDRHAEDESTIAGNVHFPIVSDSLQHGLLDEAADELGFWSARAVTDGVEDDDTRRTDCRQLLASMLAFLEHPGGPAHPSARVLTTNAAALRDAIHHVLGTDLLRRSRSLEPDRFTATAVAPIPAGTVEQMILFGRFSFDPTGSDVDAGELWSRIAAPRHPVAVADPERFCRDLADQVLPVGGWAVYGAQRLVVELLGGEYGGDDYLRMQDAALAWLHGQGVGAAHLTGWESARWAATHGAGLQDRT